MDNLKFPLLRLLQCSIVFVCQTTLADTNTFPHSLYLGAMGGYGSTTWGGIVPSHKNQNIAINMSTPIEVTEGGTTWGFFAGYEFTPYFAVEGTYIRYPDATVTFDSISLFSFMNDMQTEFITKTESISYMGKIMLTIPHTPFRAYSSFGAASVHRDDMLIDEWRLSPAFGVGLNFRFNNHFMGELGANYIAGYGESQLNPTDTFFPFLYSGSLRLAYVF